ncbi:unnamed protein product [Didymodactylos carnosus]|uniref:FLYWCH-type domain-containing protein n=1 Tax=Didymodactylos carnosus TaxID=1234261 RepID=A0A8S2X0H9_9BILA|nr:unnamed protein product [Didymodactylos carnosus]
MIAAIVLKFLFLTLPINSKNVIKTGRGKDQLLLEGYRYRRDHVNWRCVKDYCTGRVLHNGVRYEMYRGHMCEAPNPEEVQRAIFNEEIRDKAPSTHNTPRQIIQDARLKINIESSSILPQFLSLQRTVQRHRRDAFIPITKPKVFNEIVIPPQLQVTIDDQKFLIYDNGDPERRILIFASPSQLKRLAESDVWFADGTFKVCMT